MTERVSESGRWHGESRDGEGSIMKQPDLYTGFNPKLTERSRKLRRNMTRQEKHLWYDFLSIYPVKIYRQRSIDCFIADFYCSQARLVIEIDGGQHYTEEGLAYDKGRTEALEKHGLEVIRFTNREVDQQFEGVCKRIDERIKERNI